MSLETYKLEIEKRTGIPAALLTGETTAEVNARAKALLAYKGEHEAARPKTTAEQFEEWVTGEEAAPALGYPKVSDGGEMPLPDEKSAAEQFAEFFNRATAFNPFTDSDGWTRII